MALEGSQTSVEDRKQCSGLTQAVEEVSKGLMVGLYQDGGA